MGPIWNSNFTEWNRCVARYGRLRLKALPLRPHYELGVVCLTRGGAFRRLVERRKRASSRIVREPLMIPTGRLPARLPGYLERIAVRAPEGKFTYGDLAAATNRVANRLLATEPILDGQRVALLISPGFRFVAAQWGTWVTGGISVPLCITHPEPELAYVVDDAEPAVLVTSSEFREQAAEIAGPRKIRVMDADRLVLEDGDAAEPRLPTVAEDRAALIVYTSGSTGPPKGAVWSHRSLTTQLEVLTEAWGWTAKDRTLLVLPLHHVHGLVNVLTCSLWNGAVCEILPRFDALATWNRLASGELTVFMAVPTIYQRLLRAWEKAETNERRRLSKGAAQLRLMVSGSAALPVSLLSRWREITGHTLLERFGMTEIGMALSNPLDGDRIPGAVGRPLPTVEVRLVDDDGQPVRAGSGGELEVRGPSVFREYWRRPDATSDAFRDKWFRTGDVAVEDDGVFRILGRKSVDIIKSGGEKISALEVEEVIREHPDVQDCAVIGVPDDDWGERVCVAIVGTEQSSPSLQELRAFCRRQLAPYKLPRQVVVLEGLPRNALGKVIKPRLKEIVAD
jgi:malonyl-CoA/methylmalonyl-CoA synthetase